MRVFTATVLVTACLGVLACGAASERGDAALSADDASVDASVLDVGPEEDARTSAPDAAIADAGDTTCYPSADLIVTRSGGYVQRIYARATVEQTARAFIFDTGTNMTFLILPPGSPDYIENYGFASLGCGTYPLPGRRADRQDPVDGLEIAGFVGTNFVHFHSCLLELGAERLRCAPLGTVWPGTEAWARLPYEDALGHFIVRAEVDGVPKRLWLDTGAVDTVLLGEAPHPGDQPVRTHDSYGNQVILYLGTATVAAAGETHQRPVLRIESLPSLEETLRVLGGNIDGLFGLSSLGDRDVAIDPASNEWRLGPER